MLPASLDILIPTYNRAAMLAECVESVLAADPPRMEWRVTVIDNNSSDDTRAAVQSLAARTGGRVRYLFEKNQGRSPALNTGILASRCSLVGIIDDDELIDPHWLTVIERSFEDPRVDYIGGPYYGLWECAKPAWVPSDWEGVLGADEPESIPAGPVRFGTSPLFLRGGNCVFRRPLIAQLLYDENLGRRGTRTLASCEDHDLFNRLLAMDAFGLYVPDLIIHHRVPSFRVRRGYFRRWAWGHAISLAEMDRRKKQPVVYLGKLPRYMLGNAVRVAHHLFSPSARKRLHAELEWLTIGGFVYGAYFARPAPVVRERARGMSA